MSDDKRQDSENEPTAPADKSKVGKHRYNSLIVLACSAAIIGMLALNAAACSPTSTGSGSGGDSDPTASAEYVQGSLMTLHVDGILNPDATYERKDCLSCHARETIVAATDDYSGLYVRGISTGFEGLSKGLNPHQSHMLDQQCTSCHSIQGQSFMTCNDCHYMPLPEGWTDAFEGKGSPAIGEIPTVPTE
jgi:hypothetical protein